MCCFPGGCIGTSWSSGPTVSSWHSSSSPSYPSLLNRSVSTLDHIQEKMHATFDYTSLHFHDSRSSYDKGLRYRNSPLRIVRLMCRASMISCARIRFYWNESLLAAFYKGEDLTVFVKLAHRVLVFSCISSWKNIQRSFSLILKTLLNTFCLQILPLRCWKQIKTNATRCLTNASRLFWGTFLIQRFPVSPRRTKRKVNSCSDLRRISLTEAHGTTGVTRVLCRCHCTLSDFWCLSGTCRIWLPFCLRQSLDWRDQMCLHSSEGGDFTLLLYV